VPIVSGGPTAGGLAGYFREGISTMAMNPSPAIQSARARGLETRKRPCENANTSPKMPAESGAVDHGTRQQPMLL
jgi:hypothetical protein